MVKEVGAVHPNRLQAIEVNRRYLEWRSRPSADVPCNILHRLAPRGNRDSDRLARWRHRARNDGGFQLGCAIGLQNVYAESKRRAGAALDE